MDPAGDAADDDEIDVVMSQRRKQRVQFESISEVGPGHVPPSPRRGIASPPPFADEVRKSKTGVDSRRQRPGQIGFVQGQIDARLGANRRQRQLLAEEIEQLLQRLDRGRNPVLLDPRDCRLGRAGASSEPALAEALA